MDVRVTLAGWLACLTCLFALTALIAYVVGQPLLYLTMLPLTLVALVGTVEEALYCRPR